MAWNRPSEGKKEEGREKREQGKSLVRGILAALIVVTGAGIAAWWLWPNGETQRGAAPTVKPARIKEVKPAAAPVAKPEKTPKKAEKHETITTNRLGQEVHIAKDGTRSAISPIWAKRLKEMKEHPQKRVFNHSSEAYMALFLNPAMSVPPPPKNYTDAEVQAMLVEKIEIDPEKDSEDEIRQKEGVIAMKKELREWIKDGGTFDGFLKELQHRQELEAGQMQEARKMITEAMEKGEVEEARALYDKINEHFASKSMPKVNVSPKYRKILNERKEQK